MDVVTCLVYVLPDEAVSVHSFTYRAWIEFAPLVKATGLKDRVDRYVSDRRMSWFHDQARAHGFEIESHIKRKI